MLMEEIYISDLNEDLGIEIIVEGDPYSIWAYAVKVVDYKPSIEFDGFLCSRGPLPESILDVKGYVDDGHQPPLLKELSNKHSVKKDVREDDITIQWNGNMVSVYLFGELFLKMDIDQKLSYSRAINKSGSYGIAMDS